MHNMRFKVISAILAVVLYIPSIAQNVISDSLKTEIDKIELTNSAMQQMIDRYKKGAIKGDLESINQLALECMSGKNVKGDISMGLNLLDLAAKQNYVPAQYNMGNYCFLFWRNDPKNDALFSTGIKWLKKAVKGGDTKSQVTMARFYYDYGRYKKEPSYVDGSIKLLESYPNVSAVNDKDDDVLDVQCLLGTLCLGKWRMDADTTALLGAKKWFQTLLKSKKEFPDFVQYIDTLQAILSLGVPMRIDPMPTDEQIEQSKPQEGGQPGGFGGGFGGFGGFGGGFGGGQPQAPQGPQATFVGGSQALQQYIRANTYYPDILKNQKITGRATVTFTVDVDGAVINPVVTSHAEAHAIDQEALRTVLTMPDWIPAQENGQPVQAQHTVTVNLGSSGGGGMGFF